MNAWRGLGAFLAAVPWSISVIAALTLGLAPFVPKPHIVEKLEMLRAGSLRRPIDILDLVLHGIPWILLMLKAAAAWRLALRRP